MKKNQFKTIDEYIALFPKDVQVILEKFRGTIAKAVPNAVEAISYQMPTFKLNGKNLLHFAAWKSHIGFYPIPSGIEAFKKELAPYKQAKGSVQFPFGKPIPYGLVKKIAKFRAKEIGQSFGVSGNKIGKPKTCSRGHKFFYSKAVRVCHVCWPGHYGKSVQKNFAKNKQIEKSVSGGKY